jgi:hypothetical protein
MKFYFKALVLIVATIAFQNVLAQRTQLVVTGVVFNRGGPDRLGHVSVTNATTKSFILTDDLGIFHITASMGDTLIAELRDYTAQKVVVNSVNDVLIYLHPNVQLSEVNVQGTTKKQELQDIMDGYRSKGIYKNGKTSALGAIFSPLNGLYDLLGSGPKQARHFQKFAATEMQQTAIDKKFNKPFVQLQTGFKNDTLNVFMDSYRPEYNDVKKWNEYDLIQYIKKSAGEFAKNGYKALLQKLY